jgi:predicted extracellular nuclease
VKSRLTALAFSALIAAAIAAPAAQAASTTVVISQIALRGPTGGNDELIQLRNVSATTQSIGGWEVWGSSATGSATGSRATIPEGTVLPVGKAYLIVNVATGTGGSYSGSVPGDLTYNMGTSDTGGVQVRNASGAVIDAVGSTGLSAAGLAYREGAGLNFPTANGPDAFLRKASGTQDTDDNAADFTGPQAMAPENCGTACSGAQPCQAGSNGLVPITNIQTLGANASCNGTTVKVRGIVTGIDNLYGSSYDAIYKGDSGIWLQEATRDPAATTSNAIFIAGIRRDAANPAAVIGSDITITGRVGTKFGQVEIVPNGVGSTSSPAAQEVDLTSVATISSTGNPLPAPVVLDKATSETQTVDRLYYRSLQGMRVRLPEAIATGGGTTKFHDVFVEPGTTAQRLFRKNDAAAESTPWSDKPAEIGIAPDGGAGNPTDPRLPWHSTTQVDLDLFDVVRDVVGPLSFGFSFYKVMPQLTGAPAPAITRGPINATAPPTAPPQPANTLRVASFNVENYFPAGKENDGHVVSPAEYAERTAAIVKAIKERLASPDVVAVQEVAVFPDGANALTGLATALGNYTGYITTNNDVRGIATGFLVKDGTTATNGRLIAAGEVGPWANSAECDLFPGKLFDRAPYALDVKKGDLSLTAMSNHFASQSHKTKCRIDEAARLRQEAATLQQQGRNVLVAGDLNDFEFSTPLATLTQGGLLTNLWYDAPAGEAYSYKFNGHLQTLDHIAVTAGLKSRLKDMRYIHLDNDVYERTPTDGTGISDHDPPLATFEANQGASVSTPGTVSGTVPATLALTLGTPASFGAFVPGDARDYLAEMTATVTSTGADAQLSVLDPSSNATGRLVNGTYALAQQLQVNANGGAFAPLRTDNGPLTLLSWTGPVSKQAVPLGFKQMIGAAEGLRTGPYAKTLTFTLSTTQP